MDINELLEQQKVEALLKNGSGWIVAAELIMAQVAEIREHQIALEERMAMYDQPIEDGGEALKVDVVDAGEQTEGTEEPTTEPTTPPEALFDMSNAHERVNALIDSGQAEKLRKDAGLSAGDVARRLNITSGAVRGYEMGRWHPTGERIEQYLTFLLELQNGETKPEKPLPESEPPQPNGFKCLFCGRDLYGKQKKFDTKECAQSYAYIKRENPEASNSEIRTLIAGVGWADKGHKRRKYKKLDQIRAEANIARAKKSEVPALA